MIKLNLIKLYCFLFISSTIIFSQFANSQNLPEVMENQCRSEAKEIALKSYESCLSVKKTEQIENLRKEYQAKLLEIKNEYDQKIKELSTSNSSSESETQKSKPIQNLKQKSAPKKINSSSTAYQTEPTIKLKKAKPISKSRKKSVKIEPVVTQIETTPLIQEDEMTARAEEELNLVTGEVEKLEVQEMGE